MHSNPFRKRVGNDRTHSFSMSLCPIRKLTVEIRNRSTYPYQNINLSVCYDSPELKKLQTDTLTAVLADKEGIWKGDGWGGLYQSAFPAGNIKIGKPGEYLFKVAYTLPDSLLPGINDVGIKLQR